MTATHAAAEPTMIAEVVAPQSYQYDLSGASAGGNRSSTPPPSMVSCPSDESLQQQKNMSIDSQARQYDLGAYQESQEEVSANDAQYDLGAEVPAPKESPKRLRRPKSATDLIKRKLGVFGKKKKTVPPEQLEE